MSSMSGVSTKELCNRYSDAETTLEAVQRQTLTIKASILEELTVRNMGASCAFLQAVAMGLDVKPKDYFKD
jgi:hypothetical protein